MTRSRRGTRSTPSYRRRSTTRPSRRASSRTRTPVTHRFDEAIATFVLADVLVHTWDLARATGLDERLDPELVHEIAPGMLGVPAEVADAMRSSGQYGAPVELAGDADEQARLIAFTGRRP
jgi:uncharacterized protein (TIGR03086 family)